MQTKIKRHSLIFALALPLCLAGPLCARPREPQSYQAWAWQQIQTAYLRANTPTGRAVAYGVAGTGIGLSLYAVWRRLRSEHPRSPVPTPPPSTPAIPSRQEQFTTVGQYINALTQRYNTLLQTLAGYEPDKLERASTLAKEFETLAATCSQSIQPQKCTPSALSALGTMLAQCQANNTCFNMFNKDRITLQSCGTSASAVTIIVPVNDRGRVCEILGKIPSSLQTIQTTLNQQIHSVQ